MKRIKGFDIRELNIKQNIEIKQKRLNDAINVRFSFPKQKAKNLKRIAFDLNTSISEIVCSAITQFIEQFNQDNVERLIFKKNDK